MEKPIITTLKNSKKAYKPISIQEELAKNLRERIKSGQSTFNGLIGYENSVIPDIERAILSGHNINLLGLKDRQKQDLLDK